MTAGLTALAFSPGAKIGVPLASGLVDGCVYGLVALGLVLIYKSNKIFNFAQGEFGSVAALVAVSALKGLGPFPKLPYPVAILVGLAAGTLTGYLTERLLVRRLFNAPRTTLLVATAGVALFLISGEAVLLGTQNLHVFPGPAAGTHYALFGSLSSPGAYIFGFTQIDIVLTLAALALVAVYFFRTRFGRAILAVSQDAIAARIVGISVSRISALTWSLAGLIGAIAGLVYAPEKGALTPGFMTGIGEVGPLVFGFIAAVFGGMTSLPGAFVGGLLVGVIGSFAGTYFPSAVPGGEQVTLVVLLLVVLLVRPTGLLGRET
ncbi:MAG: branched-chain amino acid ABC transporter permease [Mycobacteriales bacterium]